MIGVIAAALSNSNRADRTRRWVRVDHAVRARLLMVVNREGSCLASTTLTLAMFSRMRRRIQTIKEIDGLGDHV
jgi:hypothetical protein